MSSFLFSTSITLVLLSIILPLCTADLVDIDGDPIHNGMDYYIIPISTTTKTSLTYTSREYSDECPLYITKAEHSLGTPVTIRGRSGTPQISLKEGVSLAFQGPTPCGEFLEWGITIERKLYVALGGQSTMVNSFSFSITQSDNSESRFYELNFGTGYNPLALGLYEDDGFLGATESPTMVSFKKAFNFLELSTS